jgi:hypothetical protein
MKFIAFDQWGSSYKLKTAHPRKELCELFGRQHVGKMYVDKVDKEGKIIGSQHVGYIIAGHWLTVYKLSPFQQPHYHSI